MSALKLRETETGVEIDIKVLPRSSRSEIVGVFDGAVKVKLSSPPVDGAANAELIKLFAKTFGISKSSVEIIGGLASRSKRLALHNVNAEKVCSILQAKS
jgi:uncharacterized protein